MLSPSIYLSIDHILTPYPSLSDISCPSFTHSTIHSSIYHVSIYLSIMSIYPSIMSICLNIHLSCQSVSRGFDYPSVPKNQRLKFYDICDFRAFAIGGEDDDDTDVVNDWDDDGDDYVDASCWGWWWWCWCIMMMMLMHYDDDDDNFDASW